MSGGDSDVAGVLLDELELQTGRLAVSVDSLIERLTATMHDISLITVDSVEVYRHAVCSICDGLDANIKCMYQLMTKTEQLNRAMKEVYPLSRQVVELKRLLDLLESVSLSNVS